MPLLFLFILVPVTEIFLFITIGEKIGVGWTIVSVLATAFIGTSLVRKQGLAAWSKAQRDMQHNQLPMEEIFTGLCLLVAGALLLTPGFLTDTIGFTLLVPPIRKSLGMGIWTWIQKNGKLRMHTAGQTHHSSQFRGGFGPNTGSKPHGHDDIIDGDFEIIDPEAEKPKSTISESHQLDNK